MLHILILLLSLALSYRVQARTVPDPGNPLGFFTTVADKLLRNTFPFGVTNIPVCSNGVYVYTPAVQRLLQLSANLLDAANTNFFPSVFRPLFASDADGNVFVTGYLQVTNVSGPADPQLSPPHDPTQLAGASLAPIVDANGPVNVYGVPWIIGAKKGLPGFNQLYLTNTVQIARKLLFSRPYIGAPLSLFTTNQMFDLAFNTGLGVSFWNPYRTNYPDPVTVFARDTVCSTLTLPLANGSNITWTTNASFFLGNNVNGVTVSSWPGTQWSGLPPEVEVANPAAALLHAAWSFSFPASPAVYRFAFLGGPGFDPIGSPTSSIWETTTPPLPQLPNFGLATTNYLQAFILDGNNIIDYVQLLGPNSVTNLGPVMADPNYPGPANVRYQWSTNSYPGSAPNAPTTFGLFNQIFVSWNPNGAPPSGLWADPGGFLPPAMLRLFPSQSAEAAFFSAFFTPISSGGFEYNGQVYYNTQIQIQAPYTPRRVIISPILLQANDPLVHYLASDLDAQTGANAVWANGSIWPNGLWKHIDDLQNSAILVPPATPIGGRFQPWGVPLTAPVANANPTGYDLACRDPLVWLPDDWNFPTNLLSDLTGLGQVHRGTPWQTFFLKSTNVLQETTAISSGGVSQNSGTNQWLAWTGDFDAGDATIMAPVNDWQLAGLLLSLFNTNDPAQLLSVNDPNLSDWQQALNGLVVYSNSAAVPLPNATPQYDTYVMVANSSRTAAVAGAIIANQAGHSGTPLYSIGDILATPALTAQSPYLNLAPSQMNDGIGDAAYEAIPAQLLPLLRPDSIGSLMSANGAWQLSFSGADGYLYVLQSSTNLTDWVSLGTNQTAQGAFSLPVGPGTSFPGEFFRTLLVP